VDAVALGVPRSGCLGPECIVGAVVLIPEGVVILCPVLGVEA